MFVVYPKLKLDGEGRDLRESGEGWRHAVVSRGEIGFIFAGDWRRRVVVPVPGHWSQRATDALDGKVPRPRPQHQKREVVKPKARVVFLTLLAQHKYGAVC